MKTLFKTLATITAVTLVAACAYAADQTTPQTWTPGWRHEQMVKAFQDGTATPGFGPGMMMRAGYGPGRMGQGPAWAIGPDGKIDPSKLPEGCPLRDSQTTK